MRQSSQSKYFPMFVSKLDHPLLFNMLEKERGRGRAKKFICDAAEERLLNAEQKDKESVNFERLEEQLEEIRKLLLSGNFAVKTNEPEKSVKQSPKVSGLLSALGL